MTSGFNIRMPTEQDLARYREAALREITEANRPRLMALIEQIQPATAALLDGEKTRK